MTSESNVTIEKFINKSEDDDLNNDFFGAFSWNQIIWFTNFHRLINKKNVQYPSIMMNTDRGNKKGTQW